MASHFPCQLLSDSVCLPISYTYFCDYVMAPHFQCHCWLTRYISVTCSNSLEKEPNGPLTALPMDQMLSSQLLTLSRASFGGLKGRK